MIIMSRWLARTCIFKGQYRDLNTRWKCHTYLWTILVSTTFWATTSITITTVTRSTMWRSQSTNSHTASRIIIPVTFTARRSPVMVSEKGRVTFMLPWLSRDDNVSRVFEWPATCGYVVYPISTGASTTFRWRRQKLPWVKRKLHFCEDCPRVHPPTHREYASQYARMLMRTCMDVSVCTFVSTLQLELRFLTWVVKLTRIVNWLQRHIGTISYKRAMSQYKLKLKIEQTLQIHFLIKLESILL